ncbi:exopolysaccharide biosynthesis protein [Nitzschia inconspicua]|uniref:Exopolysaccharide biosynthesis protein n=1 Tax=Nitzschia inconspicua TaxID=303405 RepID=A0A9K3M4T3_9STRA|nr:exopolysaccharide biosynthesis protein [Nitzschia inconspicua]
MFSGKLKGRLEATSILLCMILLVVLLSALPRYTVDEFETYERQNDSMTRAAVSSSSGVDDANMFPPVILPMSRRNGPFFVNATTVVPSSRSNLEMTHLIRTNYPWKVVLPPSSSFQTTVTKSGRHLLDTTLKQAQLHNCDVAASNGGPFAVDGLNTGPTVISGMLQRTTNSSLYDTTLVGFGTTIHHEWLLGNYRQLQAQYGSNVSIDNFCTGFGWLVYRGTVVANNTVNPTGAYRAPRTAIGLDRHGNVLLVVADGCEKCIHPIGPTLEELATMMVDHGAMFAVNMDGGRSSTLVYGRTPRVINRPTCVDLPFPSCQRKVATVHCIFHPKTPFL